MARTNDFVDESINVYIDYDYLTVGQYIKAIDSINGVYKELIKFLIFDSFQKYDYWDVYYTRFLEIPLCIEQVNTGNSINTKISLESRFFPGFEIENRDTLKIILPKWSAALFLASQIISFGMDKYEQYLDIRLKEMEYDEKQKDLVEETKSEVRKQSALLQASKNKPNNASYMNI